MNNIKQRVLSGELLDKKSIMQLCDMPLKELCVAANDIRKHFCKNNFDICTIINGKCGRCSEDCKYCAQSVSYTHLDVYKRQVYSSNTIGRRAKC